MQISGQKKDYPQPSVLCELTGGKLHNRATGKLPNALNPQITQIHTTDPPAGGELSVS